jgi:lactonase
MYIGETNKTREIFLNRVYSILLSDNSLDTIAFDFELPNGVASSPDGKELYIADYLPNKLYKAEVVKGKVRPLVLVTDLNNFGLANPDGLAVSQDGYIFLALYAESEKVVVIAPDGIVKGSFPPDLLHLTVSLLKMGKLCI